MAGPPLLFVERRGSGPPVLLVHGFAATSFVYRHWAPELARRFEVHLIDLKGCGEAPKPRDGRYGPRDLAAPIVEHILAHDLRDLTLVGHSLGGGVTLLAALALVDLGQLDRVRALIGIASAAYLQREPPFVRLSRTPFAPTLLRAAPKASLMSRVVREIVYDPDGVTDAQVEGYANPLRSADACHAAVQIARQAIPPDLTSITRRYAELDVPSLVLWGRSDRVVPLRLGERLARDLPRGRLVVIDECGHIPQEETPAVSRQLVERFLEEHAPTQAGKTSESRE